MNYNLCFELPLLSLIIASQGLTKCMLPSFLSWIRPTLSLKR